MLLVAGLRMNLYTLNHVSVGQEQEANIVPVDINDLLIFIYFIIYN